jgi:hypothetical protein
LQSTPYSVFLPSKCSLSASAASRELVERMDLGADFFLGLERHDDELAVRGRVQHPPQLVILCREILDILHKVFHHGD